MKETGDRDCVGGEEGGGAEGDDGVVGYCAADVYEGQEDGYDEGD